MTSYRDRNGNDWDIRLDVGLVGRLRTDAGFNLGKEMVAERIAETLFTDPESFAKVLWVLCREQAEKRTITPEQFVSGLDFEAINNASLALMEAITDFFHRPAVAAKMKSALPGWMAKVDAMAVEAVDRAFSQTSILRTGAGGSPASSESTLPR